MSQINVPPPFNGDSSDIEQTFIDFSNQFDTILTNLLANVRNTSNGMEPLLNVVIAPGELITDLTQPLVTISNILDTYSTSWGDPLNFIGSALEAYLFVKFQLKTLSIITPDMFIRIVESTMALAFANARRNLDLRITSLPVNMKFVEMKYTMDNMTLASNFELNRAKIDINLLKDIQHTKLYIFKENVGSIFVFFFIVVAIVTVGLKVYGDQRWKRLGYR